MAASVLSEFDWSDYKVYVHGPGALDYMRMFYRQGLKGASDIDEADIVCFTGGEDVNPALYGEKNLEYQGRLMSGYSEARDDLDLRVYGYAADKVKVGICRGGQLLNVVNGGSMWQHVTGHAGGPHDLTDIVTGAIYRVTSTHHQMMRPGPDGLVLATAREARMKLAHGDEWHLEYDHKARKADLDDVEVVWYENSKSLCFQPHPEFGGAKECTDYFFELLEAAVSSQ